MSISTAYSVLERTSVWVTGTFKDYQGTGIPPGNLTSLTLTLYDESTGQILNNRSLQNVLNTNGVTIIGTGEMTWVMDPADNALIDAAAVTERHIALFEWTWGSPERAGKSEIGLQVMNLTKVPTSAIPMVVAAQGVTTVTGRLQ